MTRKIEITLNIKRKNGTGYSKKVQCEIEVNMLRTLGSINGTNNIKAINLLFGNQFIGEEIVSYTGYREFF